MLSVSISINNNKATGKFVADSYFFEKDKYEYAFYLMKEGEKERLDARWYEDNLEADFYIVNIVGVIYIKCFVRDKRDNTVRTFDSEKVSIDI